MSSMLEQLWPVFLAEVSEKLDTVEAMIARAINQTVAGNTIDVDALFREFHTLKSSFSMVDFRTPMELAHACEDVLHGLRKTNETPGENILKYLQEAIDWIKQQLATASPGQYPQQAHDTLLAQLAPFRPQDEDESTQEAQTVTPAATNDTEESASNNIREEKEALTIDTLRISSDQLDDLVIRISQLVLQENSNSFSANDRAVTNAIKAAQQTLQALQNESKNPDALPALENLVNTFVRYRQNLLQMDGDTQTAINHIQRSMLDLRVIPLSTIFNRLPRIVRQKAAAHGKQVQLLIDGGDVAIDKGMIDIISEPLIHLLHNAIVHGIETAGERSDSGKTETCHIHVIATEDSGFLKLEVRDDGKGIDYRNVRDKAIRRGFAKESDSKNPDDWLGFLFARGFNSDIPGRTSGMDVVRDQLSRIGGSIHIRSTPGKGTHFIMRMPVTVAIQNTLLVHAAGQDFAIPTRHVNEIIEIADSDITQQTDQPVIGLRDHSIPVYALQQLLQLEKGNKKQPAQQMAVILQNDIHRIALCVDNVTGRQDLFLRDIHQDLRNIPGVGGVSLLGNGNAIIILDCENLFRLATQHFATQQQPGETANAGQ